MCYSVYIRNTYSPIETRGLGYTSGTGRSCASVSGTHNDEHKTNTLMSSQSDDPMVPIPMSDDSNRSMDCRQSNDNAIYGYQYECHHADHIRMFEADDNDSMNHLHPFDQGMK